MSSPDKNDNEKQNGTYDTVSKIYVLGGIPLMILFFVCTFLLVGTCDGQGIGIRA